MRIQRSAIAAAVVAGLLAVTPLQATTTDVDHDLDILLSTVRANKKAVVAINLGLTDAEADAFWPAYDAYQADLANVQERFAKVLEDYAAEFGEFTDEGAIDLVNRYLTVEEDRTGVRRRHLKAISATLPGRKVARFYQIENKIDALLRYELAATVPVME